MQLEFSAIVSSLLTRYGSCVSVSEKIHMNFQAFKIATILLAV